MSPEELASICPKLYHITEPDNLSGIKSFGLLPTTTLIDRFEVSPEQRKTILGNRRDVVVLANPTHGIAAINDNRPLSNKKLARCLDNNLSVDDWLTMLNRRVFFFVRETDIAKLRNAVVNRDRPKLLLTFNALPLLQRHFANVEISPINSGNTNHSPARRGIKTFARAQDMDFEKWRVARSKVRPDVIKEVTVCGPVENAFEYLTDHTAV